MITINNFYDVVTNKHHNEEDWLNEIYHPDPSFDPIEKYFECITSCDIRDGRCISRCVEILKQNDN